MQALQAFWQTQKGWAIGIITGILVICLACSGLSALAASRAANNVPAPIQLPPVDSPQQPPAPVQQPPADEPAQPQPLPAGSTTSTLDVAVLQSWISQTSGEELPGSLINYIGAFCDTNPSACTWSQLSNWNVTGPAVIVTDPISVSMISYGWEVVQTYQMTDGYWGVYYCPSTCLAPKPGRAAILSSPLP